MTTEQIQEPTVEQPIPPQTNTGPSLVDQFVHAIDTHEALLAKDKKSADLSLFDMQYVDENTFAGYQAILAAPTEEGFRTLIDNALFYRTYSHLAEFAERTGIQLPGYVQPSLIAETKETLEQYLANLSQAGIVVTKRDFIARGLSDYTTKFTLGVVGMKCDIEYSAMSLPTFLMGCFSIQLLGLVPDENAAVSYLVRVLGATKHFGSYEALRARIEEKIREDEAAVAEEQEKTSFYLFKDGILDGSEAYPSYRLNKVWEDVEETKASISPLVDESLVDDEENPVEIILSLSAPWEGVKDILDIPQEAYEDLIRAIAGAPRQ